MSFSVYDICIMDSYGLKFNIKENECIVSSGVEFPQRFFPPKSYKKNTVQISEKWHKVGLIYEVFY